MLKSLLLTLPLSYACSLSLVTPTFSNQPSKNLVNSVQTNKIEAQSFREYKSQQNLMNKMFITEPLSLQIWENDPRIIPPGTSSSVKRPVGFASLSLTFENKTEQTLILKMSSIVVRGVDSKKILMSLPARDLTLHPLEISPQRYQISSQEGYGNVQQVEAIDVTLSCASVILFWELVMPSSARVISA